MDKNIKVVFMGTPDFAVPTLKALIENTSVCLVVTQPDKEIGRKKEMSLSPIKKVALENGIEVFQPVKIRNDYEIIKKMAPDLIVTCAYGQILSEEILNIPKYGAINVHASLLPKYRGSAPIQHALLNGDAKTGVTLMYMDKGMDTGDMIAKIEYEIKSSDNCGTLHDVLSQLGASLLIENLNNIILGHAPRIKQNDEEAVMAPKILREDELINLNDTGNNIINKIRAFNPYPLAYLKVNDWEFKVIEATFMKKENTNVGKVNITKNEFGIEVKDGIIYLKKIKPLGKKAMLIKDYLNGLR